MNKAIAMASLVLLAGCATGGPGVSTYFECERGTKLRVDKFGEPTILVFANGGKAIKLKQVESGSGIAYQSAMHSLRSKGNEAMWTVGRMMPEQCSQVVVPR